ncbi:MAG: hypothetical protein M1833_000499 [Piccolia ochrophora]|nr:MAG: hypothetical protein M1833_000499 [Piccolia ochrophora]
MVAALSHHIGSDSLESEARNRNALPSISFDSVVLSFLYPAKTAALVRQLSSNRVEDWKGMLRKQGATRKANRYHTSAAIRDEGQTRGISYSLPTPTLEAVNRVASSALAVEPEIDRRTEQVHEEQPELDDYIRFDETWRSYKRDGDTQSALSDLSNSTRIIDAERSMQIFDSISPRDRDSQTYKLALAATLKLGRLEDAIDLHHEALSWHPLEDVGSSVLFAHLVQKSDWQRSSRVRRVYRSTVSEEVHLWSLVDKLPSLCDLALSLSDYTKDPSLSRESEAGAPKDEIFQLSASLIRRALYNLPLVRRRGIVPELFTRLQHLKLERPRHYRETLTHHLANGTASIAVEVYDFYRQQPSFKSRKLGKDTLKELLQHFCLFDNEAGISKVFEDWRLLHGRPSLQSYKIATAHFAARGEAKNVEEYLRQQHESYGPPDNAGDIHMLMHMYARRGELENAIALFETLLPSGFKPTLESWNILLNAYRRADDVDGAQDCYRGLLDAGLTPDEYTFGTLVGMCAHRGDVQAVEAFVQDAKANGFEHNVIIHSGLVLAHINTGAVDRAEEIAVEALSMPMRGSLTTMWNHILNARGFQRNLPEVMRVYQRMLDAGVPFDTFTYAALINSLVLSRQYTQAAKILRTVMRREGVRPTSLHFGIVMRGYMRSGDLENLMKLFRRMHKMNIKSTVSTNLAIIRGSVQQEEDSVPALANLDLAEDMMLQVLADTDVEEAAAKGPLKGLSKHSVSQAYPSLIFDYLIFAYGQRGEYEKAMSLYQKYCDTVRARRPNATLAPPIRLLSALLVAALQADKYDDVDRCWQLAVQQSERLACPWDSKGPQKQGWVLPSRKYLLAYPLTHYIRALARQNRLDDMRSTVTKMLWDGHELDRSNWNTYIELLAKHGFHIEAFEYCEAKLMDAWQGWSFQRKRSGLTRATSSFSDQYRHNLRPVLHTLSALARALVDLKSEALRTSGSATTTLDKLRATCPRTLDAIQAMPAFGDDVLKKP